MMNNRPQVAQPTRDEVGNLLCPLCNSELKLRHGQYGDFFGCTNYDANTKSGCTYKISANKVVGAIPDTAVATAQPKHTGSQQTAGKKSKVTAEDIRRYYDEVMAEFKDEVDRGFLNGEDIRAIVNTLLIQNKG